MHVYSKPSNLGGDFNLKQSGGSPDVTTQIPFSKKAPSVRVVFRHAISGNSEVVVYPCENHVLVPPGTPSYVWKLVQTKFY